jgi:hypothetical protein
MSAAEYSALRGAEVYLDEEQCQRLRQVLVGLHRRDEAFGLLPAVDRGPPRGLIDCTCRAVADGEEVPDLRQMPPNVFYAARALQLLAGHPVTANQVEKWLRRNHAAAWDPIDLTLEAMLPIEGCRTHEDVRNRILVGIEEFGLDDLDRLDRVIQDGRPGPTLV